MDSGCLRYVISFSKDVVNSYYRKLNTTKIVTMQGWLDSGDCTENRITVS